MLMANSRGSFFRSSIIILMQCVDESDAEHAVSHTKLGPLKLYTKLKRFAMMARTVLVPARAPEQPNSLGMLHQSSLSLPTAKAAWMDFLLVIFFVSPIIARLCDPASMISLCTGSMPPASAVEISKCLLSNISVPSQ